MGLLSGSVLLERAGDADEIGATPAVIKDTRQGVHGAVLPDRDRIHVRRPLSVLEEDGSMIGVLPRRDVVCDQMRVLLSLGFTLRRGALYRHPPSVEVDRAAGHVMQGAAVGAEREAEIAVAELVVHSAALRRLRREALEHVNAVEARIEAEQVA